MQLSQRGTLVHTKGPEKSHAEEKGDFILSALSAKPWAFANSIDQDQTAQNVQSDLGSMLSAC